VGNLPGLRGEPLRARPELARALSAPEPRCGLAATDEKPVFQYALKLLYPNGRTFDYLYESERPLKVGHEFDAFGRTWQITGNVPPSRFSPVLVSEPEAFACRPLGESGLHRLR